MPFNPTIRLLVTDAKEFEEDFGQTPEDFGEQLRAKIVSSPLNYFTIESKVEVLAENGHPLYVIDEFVAKVVGYFVKHGKTYYNLSTGDVVPAKIYIQK
jgi:hypothetical protein